LNASQEEFQRNVSNRPLGIGVNLISTKRYVYAMALIFEALQNLKDPIRL
ncbi:5906_t:CDS:2, partial [Scutellospora calospora]